MLHNPSIKRGAALTRTASIPSDVHYVETWPSLMCRLQAVKKLEWTLASAQLHHVGRTNKINSLPLNWRAFLFLIMD